MRFFGKCIVGLFSVFVLASNAIASEGGHSTENLGIPPSWIIAPVSSLLALAFAWFFYRKVMAAPQGNEKMIEIAGYVREGAYA